MPNTPYTLKLEKKRNSPEVQDFKREVICFLQKTEATEEISYKLRCDLSKKIDMPFYGETKKKPVCVLSTKEIAKEYIRLLILYDDLVFSEELLAWLIKHQGQTFRKIHKLSNYQKARKAKYKKGIFEHPVPVSYSRRLLLKYIAEKNFDKASQYIEYMSTSIPQIFLTVDEDILVNLIFKEDMPKNWDYKKDSPFARYIMAGIPNDVYDK